jgi:hypothetical protein
VLGTNETVSFVAVRTVEDDEPLATDTEFTATSVAQPTATSATKSVTTTLTVSEGAVGESCPGCTFRTYTFHNVPLGDTTTQTFGWMSQDPAVQLSSHNYSTEAGSGQGRALVAGGSGPGETSGSKVLDLRYRAPGAMTMGGTASADALVSLFVSCPAGSTASLAAYVGSSTTNTGLGGFTSFGSASSATACTGPLSFSPVTVRVPVQQFAVSKNKYLEVRVQLQTGGPSAVRVLYDAPGFASHAVLPQVSP